MISSRTLLLSLIVLNLIALAWWSGAMNPLLGSVRQPHRVNGQIEADRLELRATPVSARQKSASPGSAVAVVPASDTAVIAGTFATADQAQGERETEALSESNRWPGRESVRQDGIADPHQSGLAGINSAVEQIAATQARSVSSAMAGVAGVSAQPQLTKTATADPAASNQSLSPDADGFMFRHNDAATRAPIPTERLAGMNRNNNAQLWISKQTETSVLTNDRPATNAASAGGLQPSADAANESAPPMAAATHGLAAQTDASSNASLGNTPSATTELPLIAAAISGSQVNALPVGATQISCIRYSGVPYTTVRELEESLLPFNAELESRRLDAGNYLVYIEPLANLQLAQRKQDQLRSLGVDDMHIIQIGYYRNGISLGLLRTYERAKMHLTEMADRGVTTMRIGPVNANGSRYELSIRGPVALIERQVRNHTALNNRSASDC